MTDYDIMYRINSNCIAMIIIPYILNYPNINISIFINDSACVIWRIINVVTAFLY